MRSNKEMNHAEICLDLSVPLHIRLEHLGHLTTNEVDSVLECVCSMYNIHPTFTALQYLQALILQHRACLRRRIRLAETCDLGRTVLYLLTRIAHIQERMSCIEMFTNPHLKMHAYFVLFTHADAEVQIQIMKNMFRLTTAQMRYRYLLWFTEQMRNKSQEYKYRANCADFLLRHAGEYRDILYEAKQFLRLLDSVTRESLYTHTENVHLFVPRPDALKAILADQTLVACDTDTILCFIIDHAYNEALFRERILNDKTQLGTLQWSCTLESLLQRVWLSLTDDLRHMLLQDIESSVVMDEQEWMCTTGYYNRILNVYQATLDVPLFDLDTLQNDFQKRFTDRLNMRLRRDQKVDRIALELTETTEAERIQYLTFRLSALPQLIDELREEYPQVSGDQFDEWVSHALHEYEK